MDEIPQKGTRFQNLRLEFSRRITDVKHVKYGALFLSLSESLVRTSGAGK